MRRLVMVGTAALLLNACDGCGKKDLAVVDATVEPPVPAPANLLAEAVVATPDATWSRVQRGVGGVLAIMAPTIGGLAASLAGAEPWVGAEIDGGSPAYGVVAGSPPAVAVAFRIRSAAHARDTLAGDSGRFRAAGEKEGLAFFEPTGNGFALGIASSGWIVMAKTKDAVAALGPYAYRTLPTKPLPKANLHFDFLHEGFAGWLVPLAQAKWTETKTFLVDKDTEARAAHGGREPDFGDARAIVGLVDGWITTRTDAASDVKSGALDLDVKDDRITGALALQPGDGASKALVESMRPAPIALGTMPNASVVLVLADDLAGRKETAKATADGMAKIFGKRLPPADAAKVATALDAFATARGDWIAFARGDGDAVLVRSRATDHAEDTVKDLLALADKPAIRPLFEAASAKSASSVSDGAIRIAFGKDPRALLDAPADDRYAKAFEAIGEASIALGGHATDRDPISTIAAKRKDGRVDLAIDATPVVVRDAIKAIGGM